VSFYISSADAMMVNEPWPPRVHLPTYLLTHTAGYKETVTKIHPYIGRPLGGSPGFRAVG